ncbi:single-stranded-DNA-specific exonuclease RecJ [Anaerobacillus sp. MEB173]|uniref:single-stranded-DNA-specific exonuclease RecJ n=1 Tax=Anaerobacillus sp. MEB173 TaxID=3383345 RepID=UPI003F91164E
MLRAKTRWKVNAVDEQKAALLADELGIKLLVAQLLVNRGITTVEAARRFLYKEEVQFHDPFLLDGMKETVERIERAIQEQEKILVFGDYDADGVSSTSVMIFTLREKGAIFDFYIPNRFTEGYGPNEPALRWAKEEGYQLVVTVDTGISAVHEAKVAKEIGLDFIITDHHEPPPILPDAYSIVNPKKPGCPYPFKGLAGVGVALKLSQAILQRVPKEVLDIAAVGTIADLVPLVDENRLIAKQGIEQIQFSNKPGIKALKKICGLEDKTITSEHIGFAIGPRINAAGRLDSADPAVQLFITEDQEEADHLAEELDDLNKSRKDLVNDMAKEAIDQVEQHYATDDHRVLIVAKENWNAGVIGIVASRLVEKYYRPTIVMSIDPEKGLAKGSARSIEGFDMFENLSESRDILPHFGGHPMAAGLTMKVEHIDELRNRLNNIAFEKLTAEDFIPVTNVDLVTSVDEISIDVIEQIDQLAPFGVSNPTPKIMIENTNISQIKRIGSDENHLKMILENSGYTIDCVGFGLGEIFEHVVSTAKVSAIGKLAINEWNGHCKPQFFLDDVAVNEWQLFDYRGRRDITKRLEKLPKEKLTLLSFQEETKTKLQLTAFENEFVLMNELNPTPELTLEGSYLVLLDLPVEMKQLELLLQQSAQPERIYAIFNHAEDHFFTTIPEREHFKWFYAFLLKQKQLDLKKHADQLAKHKGWTRDTIKFMTKVFLELEFVTIDNGIIFVVQNPAKKDLVHSRTFKMKQEQARLENELFYSSYHELKNLFNNIMFTNDNVKIGL